MRSPFSDNNWEYIAEKMGHVLSTFSKKNCDHIFGKELWPHFRKRTVTTFSKKNCEHTFGKELWTYCRKRTKRPPPEMNNDPPLRIEQLFWVVTYFWVVADLGGDIFLSSGMWLFNFAIIVHFLGPKNAEIWKHGPI